MQCYQAVVIVNNFIKLGGLAIFDINLFYVRRKEALRYATENKTIWREVQKEKQKRKLH